ncbi:MAG: metallophosphoesterase [Oligoflexus sp.]
MLWIPSVSLLGFIAASSIGYFHWQSKAPTDRSGPLVIERPAGANLRLIAIGDFGSGDEYQARVAAAMEKHCQQESIDGLLLLGDNIYMDGVSSEFDPKWDTIIEKPFSSPCLSKLPRFPVLGNHDYRGDPGAQIRYSKRNPQWQFPHRFYAVKFDQLLEVIAIDTNVADICFDAEKCVLDFIASRLQESTARWKIVIGHHPLSSASPKHKTPMLQAKVLADYVCSANAYLAGHTHHLEHRKDDNCGAELFISGGGGADLHDPLVSRSSVYAEAAHGYMLLEMDINQISYRFYDTKNKELYRYQIESRLALRE